MIILFHADFPSGAIRIWTGLGSLDWNGDTYLGVGDLVSVSGTVEGSDTSVKSLVVTLAGLDASLLGALENDDYHSREGNVWMGLLDDSGIIPDPYLLFNGRLDSDEIIIKGGKGATTVNLTVTDYLADLLRVRAWRYTHEDQQALYPGEGDKGLEFVPKLQNLEISWGKAANSSGTRGSSGGGGLR